MMNLQMTPGDLRVIFPIFLILAALIGFIYRKLAIGYLNTGCDLHRMPQSNTHLPNFSDFGELLDGIMWYGFWMTNRWLLLKFDALTSTMEQNMPILHRSGTRSQVSQNTSEKTYLWLIINPNLVERVLEYLELPQEPPAVIESHQPPAYWPSSSENNSLIRVENLVIKYSPELPAVLQDIVYL
ncbi:hypothetical protein EDD18DRAFT_1112038 [Armillaria luteobubalina]|uniref:Uncharacterized protein n=1 Tax=Armillaria luteobubalina TaxID=153913 RepID=A0AA39PH90_9AGAR|nr:hypothetical protein EDD18DRAFT_1112038 [Armillaria luteobubalina]